MVRNVAGDMAELDPEDFYLLSGVEQGMRFSEWVRRDKIPEYANLTREEVDYRIDRCLDRELIERKTIQYEGYQLTFEGYDALALRTFRSARPSTAWARPGVRQEGGCVRGAVVQTARAEVPSRGVHQLPRSEPRARVHRRPRPRLVAVHRAQGGRARVRGRWRRCTPTYRCRGRSITTDMPS